MVGSSSFGSRTPEFLPVGLRMYWQAHLQTGNLPARYRAALYGLADLR